MVTVEVNTLDEISQSAGYTQVGEYTRMRPDGTFEVETGHLITSDDTPVDNLISEKQMRLLTEPLYASWQHSQYGQRFIATANVGVFARPVNPAVVVPDVLLSLNVDPLHGKRINEVKSYLIWEFGKLPDLVIEIVSNRQGNELKDKLLDYLTLRVDYYVVFDPMGELKREMDGQSIIAYSRNNRNYVRMQSLWFEELELGLTRWQGEFENTEYVWLRWCDRDGNVILTGKERADLAEQSLKETEQSLKQTEQSLKQTEQNLKQTAQDLAETTLRANEAEAKAMRLAARLRELGISDI
ncbi:MAG: Uma2 family endonuclease [Anaerolineae bacterium]|nr:Uma2 family endonuclease [Anaerolineae bacterium]